MGYVTLVALVGTTILVPCEIVKSLQLIWRLCICKFHHDITDMLKSKYNFCSICLTTGCLDLHRKLLEMSVHGHQDLKSPWSIYFLFTHWENQSNIKQDKIMKIVLATCLQYVSPLSVIYLYIAVGVYVWYSGTLFFNEMKLPWYTTKCHFDKEHLDHIGCK